MIPTVVSIFVGERTSGRSEVLFRNEGRHALVFGVVLCHGLPIEAHIQNRYDMLHYMLSGKEKKRQRMRDKHNRQREQFVM